MPHSPVFLLMIKTHLSAFGQSEDGVASRGNIFAADVQVRIRDQRGRLVGSGPPYLTVRHQSAENLAAFHARAGVVGLDRLAVAELALSLRRGAGTLACVLGTGQQGKHGQTRERRCAMRVFMNLSLEVSIWH